ncbi:MAG TPA: bacillithiol system redox-active protein YtxJ [Pyrinomonadaceae bacterium]|nr:bacillithiol system redox-active protein YtxJ [Pyrinomonadaceae bacterium]
MTEKHFTPVNDREALNQLLTRSQTEPVILFKHSTTCPISAAAYRQMSEVGQEVSLVIVQRAREVSKEVEALTGIRHESPQVIVLRNGGAVWSASHFDITSGEVERAVRDNE